jgi:hypothetical protein
LVFGCVAIGAAVAVLGGWPVAGASAIDALPITRTGGATPFHGALVVHEGECESRLDFAHVFERPGRLRVKLERTIERAEARRVLNSLGLPQVSTLLLYDTTRAVMMAIELPATVRTADFLVSWVARPGT